MHRLVVIVRARGKGPWGVTADDSGVLFGGKDNILELDSDDGYTTL